MSSNSWIPKLCTYPNCQHYCSWIRQPQQHELIKCFIFGLCTLYCFNPIINNYTPAQKTLYFPYNFPWLLSEWQKEAAGNKSQHQHAGQYSKQDQGSHQPGSLPTATSGITHSTELLRHDTIQNNSSILSHLTLYLQHQRAHKDPSEQHYLNHDEENVIS